MAKSGDRVKVKTKDKEYEGLLMPNEETDSVVVKLDSGYNIGIDSKKIKEIKVLKKSVEKKEKQEKVKENKKLPTISILHTGGTIASKVDYETGGVIARFTPEEILNMFPELKNISNIHSRLISNMFSEDMRFMHYKLMAKAVQEEIKKEVKGIIITHGTDTLHYTSAALSFILENVPVPVLLVGAQRSSDRGSSDAAINLICAAEFISKTDYCGVAVCMHKNENDNNCVVLPGTKVRKLHTSRRDAFKVVNDVPIARINYEKKKIEYLKKDYSKKPFGNFVVKDKMEEKVGLLKIHPNMFPEDFMAYKNYKGLVIEGTGLGHAPVNVVDEHNKTHEKNLKAIKELAKKEVVVMTSQCIFGRVHMHVYSSGIKLIEAGVLSGEDMTSETAFIKLAWLLGNHPKEAKKLFLENLRGELQERTDVRSHLD